MNLFKKDEHLMTDRPIRLKFNGRTVPAVLYDNPAANSLYTQLPATLLFSDYGRQEVNARIPRKLTMKGMPEGCDPEIGDIGYNVAGVVVLHYSKIGYFKGTAVLGHIDADVSIFQGWDKPVEVSIDPVA